jgi:ribose-phosphate pyrophosphokinase
VIPTQAESLSAAPLLAGWLGRARPAPLVVGPDAESEPLARATAELARAPFCVGKKQRLGDRRVRIAFPALPAVRRAVLVDDVAASGATLAVAARALLRAGVPRVDVAVVHALYAPDARARLARAGVRRVVSCDGVAHPTNAIRCAPLFADFLRERS